MKKTALSLSPILSLLLSVACTKYIPGEKISDPEAGLNGGFELSQNQLPVNWIFYTPEMIENSDFEISLDTNHYKHGSQSLRFDVLAIGDSSKQFPGFTNEFSEVGKFKGKNKYKVSMWIKSEDAAYKIQGGSVTAMGGGLRVLTSRDSETRDWEKLEYEMYIPGGGWLRLELAILSAGSLWIDHVQITAME